MEGSRVYLDCSEDRKEEQRNDEKKNKRQEDNSEDKARSRCDGERMSMGQARDRSSARREHAAQDGRKRMPVILDSRTHQPGAKQSTVIFPCAALTHPVEHATVSEEQPAVRVAGKRGLDRSSRADEREGRGQAASAPRPTRPKPEKAKITGTAAHAGISTERLLNF